MWSLSLNLPSSRGRKALSGFMNNNQQWQQTTTTSNGKNNNDNNNEHEIGKRRQKLQQPWHPTTNNHHDTQQQPGHPTTTMTPNNIEQTTTMMATASDQLTFCRTDWHLVRIWKIKSLLEWHSRVVHCSFADTVDCQILLLWHYSSVTSALVPA